MFRRPFTGLSSPRHTNLSDYAAAHSRPVGALAAPGGRPVLRLPCGSPVPSGRARGGGALAGHQGAATGASYRRCTRREAPR